MESPTPFSRYIPKKSKKRAFSGASPLSSSSGRKEVEVLEMPPPINRTPKPKSSKQKEVISHEIIDFDTEEDCDDVMVIDGKVDESNKGEEALSKKCSVGSNEHANDGSGSSTKMPSNVAADDFSTNKFYGEDDMLDKNCDDKAYDDYSVLQSHFDHVDIPTGVEAPFPWLPSSPQSHTKVPEFSSSTNSSSQIQSNGANLSHKLGSSLSLKQKVDKLISKYSKIGIPTASQYLKGELPSKWLQPRLGLTKSSSSSGTASMSSPSLNVYSRKPGKEPRCFLGKSERTPSASSSYSSVNYFPPPPPSTFYSHSGYPSMNMPTNAPAVGTYTSKWENLPLNMLESFHPVIMHGNEFALWAQDPLNSQNHAPLVGTKEPAFVENTNMDEILQKFDLFKKFDTVEDYSDHYYYKNGSSAKQAAKNWTKKIQEEWKILEKDLPDTIFVRVYESRMDLLRAVIMGAEGTPYHDGLFFFDIFFPYSYPNDPPKVHYHSGGLRINPNLYVSGKVCLSLLNTWSGTGKEKWIPGVSTILQVLVSIQGLILNAQPYFNEPGFDRTKGSATGEKRSLDYNESTYILSLRTMVYNVKRPPKHFKDLVIGHFCKHARDVLVSCKAYMDGAQVGSLVKGGVQYVDEGDKSCSERFKADLAAFMVTLINAFKEIGAKDCEEFLPLAQKDFVTKTFGTRVREGVNRLKNLVA